MKKYLLLLLLIITIIFWNCNIENIENPITTSITSTIPLDGLIVILCKDHTIITWKKSSDSSKYIIKLHVHQSNTIDERTDLINNDTNRLVINNWCKKYETNIVDISIKAIDSSGYETPWSIPYSVRGKNKNM